MKKLKKLFAVMLSLVMVLAMSMTSFAADKNTITISGKGLDAEGAGANYGQIIKENRGSTLGWQFASDNIANKFVEAWNNANDSQTTLDANGVIAQLIQLGVLESNNNENKNVEAGTINGSTKFKCSISSCYICSNQQLRS